MDIRSVEMDNKKNTGKKPIFKYIKFVEGQWNITRKDVGEQDWTFIKPSYKTEKEVKEHYKI